MHETPLSFLSAAAERNSAERNSNTGLLCMKVSYISPEILTVAVLGHVDTLKMFFFDTYHRMPR